MSSVRRITVLLALFALLAVSAMADHQWGSYHWPKSSSQVALSLGDNVDSRWDSYLAVAASDWNASSVLAVGVIAGSTSTKRCNPDTGEIEICNNRYGRTGWLGVAGIWASGSHITKGYTKLNDTYFDTATYNTPAWRAMVTCQEVGHDFGLAHQDENFNNANLGSCMDYTNSPESNQHPNAHDYEMLETMYGHTDAASVIDSMATGMLRPPTMGEILADAGQWGTPISFDSKGRPDVFELILGMSADHGVERLLTHVLWAPIDVEIFEPGEPKEIERAD